MSTVNIIAAMQSSIQAATGKSSAQQIAATSSQSKANTSSSVTISSSGTTYSRYEQQIAQAQGAQNQHRANAVSDPSWGARYAYDLAHDNSMTGSPVGGLLSIDAKATDPAIYASGAPVTVASQAYFTKQNAIYQNQVLELYNTEKAKGTAPGQLISDIYDLQAKQPDAFRAMMMWPPASDPLSIQAATNTPGTPPQYLYGDGQVAKS
ncbi:hypothetical protein [Devosia sp.]|uniref:hypothetical protein n=1 Tax=Devosia sp. TaxID=1871048 RepID=UPI00273612C4|nr:hypothetical protein [Devosia sp.]MDP2779960.1 hypothetical protein [Devosia sp.]